MKLTSSQAILGSVLVFCLLPTIADASSYRDIRTQQQLVRIEMGLEALKEDVGILPDSSEGLGWLVDNEAANPNWNGPYIAGQDFAKDAWGEPFIYIFPAAYGSEGFDLYSKGVNLRDDRGGEDDITNWSGIPSEFYERERTSFWFYLLLAPILLLVILIIYV